MNHFTPIVTAAILSSTVSMHAITPEEGRVIRNAFEDSLLAIRESGDLAQPPPGQASFVMPAEQEKRMIALIENGLSLSTKVTDHFLAWVHPQKQAEGIQLQVKWIEWWEAKRQLRLTGVMSAKGRRERFSKHFRTTSTAT